MNNPVENLETDPEPERYYRAASASLWLPIVAAVFGKGISDFLRATPGQIGWWAAMALGAVAGLLLLLGFIFGIAALCGVLKHGREGILVRAVIGLCLGLLLPAFFVRSLVSDFSLARPDNQLALARQESAARKMVADMKREREAQQEVSAARQPSQIQGIQSPLVEAPAGGYGDMVMLARASGAFMQKVQPVMNEYLEAMKALQEPHILDLSGVEHREQVAEKKALVQRFLAANDKLAVLAADPEKPLREEMEKISMPAKSIEAALEAYRRSSVARVGLAGKVRDSDRRLGKALIAILDLLDVNWGRWSYNPEKQRPTFQDDAVLDKFITCRNELETATREQQRLQTQLGSQASL